MKRPELLAPGGSFLSAYYALEAGADGVYLGLTEFSARKAAANFTFDQLRRIRQLAAERGGRIYVTLNTIIRESELSRLADALCRLEAASVDGVIVQDLGVLSILRRHFPRIPIHASTQMAVHNAAGIRYLKSLGVTRVILSRELTLERIRALRAANPDVELEVFIHGALCYGFSGVCLASSVLTGRSGNRGDCAQICRSLFSLGPRQGYFFSCRDLCLGEDVLEIARAGVDALKIEGRMKSPEYVFYTTALYRAILDGEGKLPPGELAERMRKAAVSYSREKTSGFLRSRSGSSLIDVRHPGHKGALLGAAGIARGGEVSVRLESDLSIRDGLAFFPPSGDPFIFSVQRISVAGKSVKYAGKGQTASVSLPDDGIVPKAGQPIYQLSSRFLDLKQPKEASVPVWKTAVDLEVSLSRDGEGPLITVSPAGGLPAFMAEGGPCPFSRRVVLEPAAHPKSIKGILERLFRESGESLFTLGRLSLANAAGVPDDGIFIPPSVLKKVRKEFYEDLEARFEESLSRKAQEIVSADRAAPGAERAWPAGDVNADFTRRDSFSPPSSPPIPFVDAADLASPDAEGPGPVFLPLPPVILEEAEFLDALKTRISAHPGTRFAVGLSNISHLAFADGLAACPNAAFFIDYPLYVANHWAFDFLRGRVRGLLFQYFWIEGDSADYEALSRVTRAGAPLVRIDARFRPPLFYALGCFAKHALSGGTCPPRCPKAFTERLTQGGNRFTVVVKDCITYVFRD